jgi:hypothetical protein
MQVVRLNSEMFDGDFELFGFLTKQLFEPIRDGSNEHLASPARYPDEVILEHGHGASIVSVARQDRQILPLQKERSFFDDDTCRRFVLSAKAGGFLA